MTSDDAKQIFLDALDVLGPGREAFLARACGDDAALLAKVRSLIAAHESAEGFLIRPAVAQDARGAAATLGVAESTGDDPRLRDERPGDVIDGRYTLLRPLGEGGFGVVFLADQHEPVRRQVALKVLKRGMETRHVVARFRAERQALALLGHPNIARVFDAGHTPGGRPYFVMEYVPGLPITEYCDRHGLDVRRRLELMETACLAIQHAHTKGIIHRDLKPGNVLVAETDGQPEPKVIDFGVAKAADPAAAASMASPEVTREFQIIGTPQYMSPEQATAGPGRGVDTRSDVYSLGTILYELVAGAPPFDPRSLREASIDELCRIIRESSPPRPSTRLTELRTAAAATAAAAGEGTSAPAAPARRRRAVDPEVDWIVMRAMEKEPSRRYQSAAELAADIRRHLDGAAVLAGPPSATYQLRKLARRYRLQIGVAAVVLLALVGTAAVSTVMAARARVAEAAARRQADRAEVELRRAEALGAFTDSLLAGVSPEVARGRDTTLLRAILDRAIEKLPAKLAGQPLPNLVVRHAIAETLYRLGDAQAGLDTLLPAYEATAAGPESDHVERLRAGVTVATLFQETRQLDRAEAAFRETLAGYEQLGEAFGTKAAGCRVGLAAVLGRRGRYEDSNAVLREAIAYFESRGQGEDELSQHAQNNLALNLATLDRPAEAVEIWRRLIEVNVRTAGEDHPRTLATMHNLAATLDDVGAIDEAEAMHQRMLATQRRIYEPGHPMLVQSLNNFGAFLVRHDRLEEADKILGESRDTAALKLPETHGFRTNLLLQTINLRRKQGRFAEAADAAVAFHAAYVKNYGQHERRTMAAMGILLERMVDAGRVEEATALLAALPPEAIEALTPDVAHTFHASAGTVYLAAGQVDRAAEAARQSRRYVEPDATGQRKRVARVLLDLEKKLVERGVAIEQFTPSTNQSPEPGRGG